MYCALLYYCAWYKIEQKAFIIIQSLGRRTSRPEVLYLFDVIGGDIRNISCLQWWEMLMVLQFGQEDYQVKI